ncbi:alpha/beta hydrolase [Ovoidimarina sediminis]|uniref:alpha/beta hydrolase n=1 Tax=Ovoidimarina sediminis TaxID=3079856 RepID=UPI0029149EF4|nr:alpha/beta hydrolase-fold protein [Rhodophyticola sp. MJ-SS7]MDU8945677.1 alpha/beta hydrolase-fold protein [Rhodophyticola sp. MJ-SS7]
MARLSALAAALWFAAASAVAAGEVHVDRKAPSPALGTDLPYSIYLPSGQPAGTRFPVVYLLHGFGAGQREWLKGGRLEETLDRMIGAGEIAPLIAVMPDAGKSWYVDSARFNGPGDYETAITRDLVAEIDARYPTLAGPAHRGIAGISMGGHGALRLAFAHPQVFSAVAALSPGIWRPGGMSEATGPAVDPPEMQEKWFPRTTGETFDIGMFNRQSPFAHVGDLAEMEHPPAILLAVGDDDYWKLHDGTVELYIELRRAGLRPELRVDNGGHDWKYWRRVSPDALSFLAGRIAPE